MPDRPALVGPLTARLALAFLMVAMGALSLLSTLVLIVGARDVAGLARQQQDEVATVVADAAAAAYSAAGGWASANLRTPLALARLGGGEVVVLDASGRAVTGSLPAGTASHPPERLVWRDVAVGGTNVGRVLVTFSGTGLPGADRHLRDALTSTVAAGAGLAALLAVGMAVVVARRITRPIAALTQTARAVEHGDRAARVGHIEAPGELGELAVAFDRMADALALEDSLRRMLVADVAHELRTPLTVLQATLEGMADRVVAATPGQLASLHDEVLRLVRIVEDLETLAAADATGLAIDPGPVDLAQVAAAAAGALRSQFQAADLTLETRLTPTMVRGDADRLHQIVTNLLTNALKYTPAGGSVRVDAGPAAGPDGAREGVALLRVLDTGPGIPAEELPHVFERFWRGAQTRSVAGSGIGLTVVQRLVEAHAGSIVIDRRPGGGTVVSVTLPAQDDRGGSAQPSSPDPPPSPLHSQSAQHARR
ncbi:MAG TPA: ATP-binding protein [Actinomycetota bacterium]|nr:ATP-binding protein [Actinomycetota bacterium]